MTTYRYHTCVHCQGPYTYFGSGEPCRDPLNDDRHCPECRQVVLSALANVPRKFETVWVDTEEVTLQEVVAWEAEQNAGAIVRRVAFPLFRIPSGECSKQGFAYGMGPYEGRNYEYRYWGNLEGYFQVDSLKVEMIKNLRTGELGYKLHPIVSQWSKELR